MPFWVITLRRSVQWAAQRQLLGDCGYLVGPWSMCDNEVIERGLLTYEKTLTVLAACVQKCGGQLVLLVAVKDCADWPSAYLTADAPLALSTVSLFSRKTIEVQSEHECSCDCTLR